MDDKFAVTVVRLGGYLSPFVFAGALLAIIVAGSKELLNENMAAFLGCMIGLCPLCTCASYFSLKRNSKKAAAVRLIVSIGVAVVLVSIIIASLASDDCEDMVLNVFPCDHFFLQIMFYLLVLAVNVLDAFCSYHVLLLIDRNKLKDILGLKPEPVCSAPAPAASATVGPGAEEVNFTIQELSEDGL